MLGIFGASKACRRAQEPLLVGSSCLSFQVKFPAKNKPPKPAQQVQEPAAAEMGIVDLAGRVYLTNLILPGKPGAGSEFHPMRTPLPLGTFVSREFAAQIENDRFDPEREEEPGEPTATFLSGVSYTIDELGRLRGPRIVRETRQEMLAQQKADILHEQLLAERAEYEKSEFYREKAEDDAASRSARIACLNQMHERRLAAADFLAAERAAEEQEREQGTVPEIVRGPDMPLTSN
jgi:hypothetical protein